MHKCFLTALAFLSCFAFSDAVQANTIQESSTGVSFPDQVTFNYQGTNHSLHATGTAARIKLIVKIYAMAHYMEPLNNIDKDVFKQILNSKSPKQFTLIWQRNIDRAKVVDGYRESFSKVLGKDFGSLQSEVDQYLSFLGDVHTNDEHVIRWLPDGTVEVYINQAKQGSIQDEKFAKALWSIWFGKNSVVNRDNLVSLLH